MNPSDVSHPRASRQSHPSPRSTNELTPAPVRRVGSPSSRSATPAKSTASQSMAAKRFISPPPWLRTPRRSVHEARARRAAIAARVIASRPGASSTLGRDASHASSSDSSHRRSFGPVARAGGSVPFAAHSRTVVVEIPSRSATWPIVSALSTERLLTWPHHVDASSNVGNCERRGEGQNSGFLSHGESTGERCARPGPASCGESGESGGERVRRAAPPGRGQAFEGPLRVAGPWRSESTNRPSRSARAQTLATAGRLMPSSPATTATPDAGSLPGLTWGGSPHARRQSNATQMNASRATLTRLRRAFASRPASHCSSTAGTGVAAATAARPGRRGAVRGAPRRRRRTLRV